MRCDALTWSPAQGEFVECDGSDAEAVTLAGVMLAVTAHLCKAHQKYVAGRPREWASTDILKSGKSISRWPNRHA